MCYQTTYDSLLGKMVLTSDGDNLTGAWFDSGRIPAGHLSFRQYKEKRLPLFDAAESWFESYFKGETPNFTPPLQLSGTPFQMAVWEILTHIPYGKTVTYKEVAEKMARGREVSGMSARAVGNAIGHNPILIIVPCHRVIGCDGKLTGYAGGIEKKRALLAIEQRTIGHHTLVF